MMEAVPTSETSVDNNFTRQYIPEDNSEHHTRHRENLKSHKETVVCVMSEYERLVWDGPLEANFYLTPLQLLVIT
jgi:hypothetical protein